MTTTQLSRIPIAFWGTLWENKQGEHKVRPYINGIGLKLFG